MLKVIKEKINELTDYKNEIDKIKSYKGKEILCINNLELEFDGEHFKACEKGKFYELKNCKNISIKPITIIGINMDIDDFYNYFQLKTITDIRKEKINQLLK